jgi:hypothetical protein
MTSDVRWLAHALSVISCTEFYRQFPATSGAPVWHTPDGGETSLESNRDVISYGDACASLAEETLRRMVRRELRGFAPNWLLSTLAAIDTLRAMFSPAPEGET